MRAILMNETDKHYNVYCSGGVRVANRRWGMAFLIRNTSDLLLCTSDSDNVTMVVTGMDSIEASTV